MRLKALGLMFAAVFAVRWSVDAQVPCPDGSAPGMRCIQKRQFDEQFSTVEAADVFSRVIKYSGVQAVTVEKVTKAKPEAKK